MNTIASVTVTVNSRVLDRLQSGNCPRLRWVLTAEGLRMRWSPPPSSLER